MRVLGVPSPSRDRLITAALAPAPEALAAWREWRAPHDTGGAVAVRWLPLVAWNLRHERLPPGERERLAAARREAWTANVRVWMAAEPALDRLDEAGIDWMLLKGAAVAWTFYESPSLRPIGDVDLLVRPEDADRAHAALRALGWRSAAAESGEASGLHGTNYVKPPHGAVDLHAFALRENCYAGADRGFWDRRVSAVVAGRTVRVPSAGDLLLHVCVHGLRWNPVNSCHWVADAASIVARAGGRIDWPALVAEAVQRDVAHQLHGALEFVRDVAGAAVPADALAGLSVRAPLRARVERYVKPRPLHGPGGLLLMWYDWRRLRAARGTENRPGFAAYLARSMRLPSRRAILPAFARLLVKRLSSRTG